MKALMCPLHVCAMHAPSADTHAQKLCDCCLTTPTPITPPAPPPHTHTYRPRCCHSTCTHLAFAASCGFPLVRCLLISIHRPL